MVGPRSGPANGLWSPFCSKDKVAAHKDTYDFSSLSKSFEDPLLTSVSGYDSFDIASAAGADITEADNR